MGDGRTCRTRVDVLTWKTISLLDTDIPNFPVPRTCWPVSILNQEYCPEIKQKIMFYVFRQSMCEYNRGFALPIFKTGLSYVHTQYREMIVWVQYSIPVAVLCPIGQLSGSLTHSYWVTASRDREGRQQQQQLVNRLLSPWLYHRARSDMSK